MTLEDVILSERSESKDLLFGEGDYDSLRAGFAGCSLAQRLRALVFAFGSE